MKSEEIALGAWEITTRSRSLPAMLALPERSLELLSLIEPEVPMAELALWNVGRRNSSLLLARLELFGSEITAVANCPQCQRPVEAIFPGEALLEMASESVPASFSVEDSGWRLRLRPVQIADLIAVSAGSHTDSDFVQALLFRCIIEVCPPTGTASMHDQIPDSCREAAANALAEADSFAETTLALNCADCGNNWESLFDIPEFFLSELCAEGERIMDDIHALASCYGWSERDILALSPSRRAAYRERVG